jgi:replicative DNA helicase
MLDELTVLMRKGRGFTYDAGGAGQGALARLDGEDRTYPTTGLDDLDKRVGGWPLGQLTVLAGRPGAGKSAVATSAMLRTAKAGNSALFFSLEMVKEQLGARMLTDLAYDHMLPIVYEDVLNRCVEPRARRRLDAAAEALAKLPVHIEEQRGLTMADVAARSRKIAAALLREGKQLRVIFIDHMMLMRSSDRYAGNRVREVGEISEGLTELAQELDVAVVALCQLNRQVETRDNKRPTLSDLRDSGEVEQNASLVIFLYRSAYYLEQTRYDEPDLEKKRQEMLEKTRNKLEFIIAKNRNVRTGVVEAFVDIGANAIRNASFHQ